MKRDTGDKYAVAAVSGGGGAGRASAPPRTWGQGFERMLVRRMLRALHDPPVRVVLCDGQEIAADGAAPVARLVLRDRAALYRLISNPEFQFGELYSEGRLEIEGSLLALLEAVYRSASAQGTFAEHVSNWLNRPGTNTLRRARTHIHQHYDIGNDFYRLWLDEAMAYTCAYFPTARVSLEAAQQAKMEHVCRKLRLRPGQSVVEAGCGWGGLALYMARHYGVRVRAYNISRAQIAFARQRAKEQGLHERVQFIEDDYRNMSGKFDAFVSVGMLEHVGVATYGDLGRAIHRCLSDRGRGLIHTIGRNRPLRLNSWIATRIFPGGYPPALSELTRVLEPFAFSILDLENLRLHYALTLEHWLARFERAEAQVRQMFDPRFVRMWRLYLAGSMAAFTTGWMQLFQIVFTRPFNNDLPLTRAELYADSSEFRVPSSESATLELVTETRNPQLGTRNSHGL